MRILVMSDSHGNVYNVRKIIEKHNDIKYIVFLGDGESDFYYLNQELDNKSLTMVKGNCDIGSQLNTLELLKIEDNLIYCTHGYKEFVKYGNEQLISEAERFGAKLALYGHTHDQLSDYIDGLYIFNPGSVNNYQYGIVDVTKSGIVISKMDLLER